MMESPVTRPPVLRLIAFALLVSLAACRQEPKAVVQDPRPVRTVTVERQTAGDSVSLTGTIFAQDEANLSFRVGGRMIERSVNVGDTVKAGQIIARLEPDTARDALASANAGVAAAMASLVQTRNAYDRQRILLRDGWTTRAQYDIALKAMQTSQAQLDRAEAQASTARNQLTYTELVADSGGIVTARGAEPGEVVAPGRMIVQLARKGGRDAVFDVPAQVIQASPADPVVTVALSADATIRTTGRVREVAPQADPVTRTFAVRVGLDNAPDAMRLGSTVTGTMPFGNTPGISIPASALTSTNRQPAVWIVDPKTSTVSLRNIDIGDFDLASVRVAHGLEPGEIVVTAGVQALLPGQKIRLLGAAS